MGLVCHTNPLPLTKHGWKQHVTLSGSMGDHQMGLFHISSQLSSAHWQILNIASGALPRTPLLLLNSLVLTLWKESDQEQGA